MASRRLALSAFAGHFILPAVARVAKADICCGYIRGARYAIMLAHNDENDSAAPYVDAVVGNVGSWYQVSVMAAH